MVSKTLVWISAIVVAYLVLVALFSLRRLFSGLAVISLAQVDEAAFEKAFLARKQPIYLAIKRLIDIVIGLLGLIVFAACYFFLAAAILLDSPGGVLFTQTRAGKNGKPFVVYKFRTMYHEPDRQRTLWREKSGDSITRVGWVLRRLHLDELPQAWNLLKGEMSFVGPRPEWIKLVSIFQKEIPHYKLRALVKPGIVGWAQINFKASRSVTEAQEKFEYDLYYIQRRSFLLDLEVMAKSVKLFFF